MKRYKFLTKDDVYDAFNRLRDAFLAAKNGAEVEEIIKGLLTHDEKLKIGRRILIAECIKDGLGIEEIAKTLKVGKNTIMAVVRKMDENPIFLDIIAKRRKRVENEYNRKKYRYVGGAKLVFKKKEYTGFRKRDVER